MEPRSSSQSSSNEETNAVARRRLLLVDDDDDVRSVFEIVLAEVFDVRSAATGAEAVALANSWRPHALLLDWTLPDVSGEDLVASLRATIPDGAALPIVVVSGDPTVKDIALRIGAIACPKPCNVDQLMAAIERALCGAREST